MPKAQRVLPPIIDFSLASSLPFTLNVKFIRNSPLPSDRSVQTVRSGFSPNLERSMLMRWLWSPQCRRTKCWKGKKAFYLFCHFLRKGLFGKGLNVIAEWYFVVSLEAKPVQAVKNWSDETLFLTSSDRQFFTRVMSELLLMMRFCLHFLANHGQIGQLFTPIRDRGRKQVQEFDNSGTGEGRSFPTKASTSSTWKNFSLSWTLFIVSLIIIQTRVLASPKSWGSIFFLPGNVRRASSDRKVE